MELKIENNIPAPEQKNYQKIAKQIFSEMKSGETVWFERPLAQKIQAAISYIKHHERIKERVFISRSEKDGIRFWRV